MIILNNKYTVTFTDDSETIPSDGFTLNFIDNTNDGVAKVRRKVTEMEQSQTDWLASTPVLLFDKSLIGDPGELTYLALQTSMPLYVWFELPTLVPGVGGVDTPKHIKVKRLLVIDGAVETIYGINPALYNSGSNNATVSIVAGYIIP